VSVPAIINTPSLDLAARVAAVETWDENVALARQLAEVGTACQWALGDLAVKAIADGDHDTLRGWADEVGVTHSQARNYHLVARHFPAAKRLAEQSWSVHLILAGDPDRHAKLTALPTGATAREARDLLVRAGKIRPNDDQTPEEQLAAQVEARNQAMDAAFARPAHATARHGADPSNPAEMADAIHQAVMQEEKENRSRAHEWDEAPAPVETPVPNQPGVSHIAPRRAGDVVAHFAEGRRMLNTTSVSGADINRIRVIIAECYELLAEWEAA
jgi:hypothetical protein